MLLQLRSFHVCPLAEQHRNMCPITEWNCWETRTQRFVHKTEMKPVDTGNYVNYKAPRQIFFCLFTSHFSTLMLLVCNHLSGYRLNDFICISLSCETHPPDLLWFHELHVWLSVQRENGRKRACLHLDLWCRIGNQYGSFKSFRCSDWYLEWPAYGLGTRAVSLTVPIWVTLSALMPVHLLFVLKWISCK